jgi:TRAP-type mannitol/chloroaromatic compound transport system substrate-binding protein
VRRAPPGSSGVCFFRQLQYQRAATNPDFKKILDSQMAFRDDGNPWWQVAEYSYETFVIRTRPKG